MSAYCLFDNLEVIDVAKIEEYKDKSRRWWRNTGGATSFSVARSTLWKVNGGQRSPF